MSETGKDETGVTTVTVNWRVWGKIEQGVWQHPYPPHFSVHKEYAHTYHAEALEQIATLAAEVERLKGIVGEMKFCVKEMDDAHELAAEYEQQLATARADAMREVREGVEKMERYWPETDDYVGVGGSFVSRAAILALLDATRGA